MKHQTSIKAVVFAGIVLAFGLLNSTISKLNKDSSVPTATDAGGFSAASLFSTGSLEGNEPYTLGNARAGGVFTLKGEKLVAWSDTKKWPIASLTKLMTALVASDVLPYNRRVVIKSEYIEMVDGSSGTVFTGEEFTVEDLKEAILLVSSNVAAEALAGEYGRADFIDRMNRYAAEIGMKDTYFADPSGLSVKNQSTVDDLAKLVNFILVNKPAIFAVTREPREGIYEWKTGSVRTITNINPLVTKSGFLGGKTGTTPEAVGNLISVFSVDEKQGRVVVVLGSEERFKETERLLEKWH